MSRKAARSTGTNPNRHCIMPELGKFLIVVGLAIVVLGILLWTGMGIGFLGKLPGDIRIQRGNSAFYFPIVTCIIISIVLSLIFSLFRR
jgi:uncharacterized membrane protein YidH (DUF202 family)